jgi:histidinol-phosphate phosphatase family protein
MKLTDIDITDFDTLFLDRDGVINRLRHGDYVKCWDEFEFLPDVFDALKKWSQHFKHIIIVTNQRGVGKGLMTEKDLNEIHKKMIFAVEQHGGRIDKIYYCTALDDDNINRKPNTGMAMQAKCDFPDIDFNRSLMIGDSTEDMLFAENAGMKGVKI